ncbi:MAG TPA: TolC family protein [Pseudomonas xinjiangensis]|uniref:TolC family protein n=2 Tax=root TaxID=1 RepID=A0A7V1BRL5_9GAMM|nr:TolC family protein [Halopseudomonas xinjiangensis]HEC46557.1 TolC family protein [Halopseudomonas xinjiangensis]
MNYQILRVRSFAAVLAAGLLAVPGMSAALTLEEAIRLAEREAPSLAARTANLQAAQSSVTPAGELPDPKLRLGVQNLPIEGDSRLRLGAERMTMQKIGVMQEVPNRAKRRARVEAAEASVRLARVQQTVERLKVRQLTAEAWIATLAAEQKLTIFDQLYTENRVLTQAVKAKIAGARGLSSDSVLPKQEAALLAEQEDALARNETVARAELQRWIGEAATEPLEGSWPVWRDDFDHYRHNLHRHPDLLAFDPMSARAEAKVNEAISDKTPDWGWGVDYQRRGGGFGDMVSVSVSFDLPVFAGSRQDPKIAAERARLAELEAERQAMLLMHNQELAADLAELQRLERALARVDETLLPLAEEKVRLAMADYRSGNGELTFVIAARQELVEIRLRRVDLARDRSLTNARLHFAFGDTQP